MPASPKRSEKPTTIPGPARGNPAPVAHLSHRELLPRWFAALLIIAMVLLAYLPVVWAGYVWDDSDHVTQNSFQRTTTVLKWVWFKIGTTPQYYPLTHTTFWLEYRLWGDHPAGYHIVNVLLHAGCALLLWRLLRQLNVGGAFWAAAIFALHPVHVESVAWITERKNTLSTLFYLVAMGAALRAWAVSPGVTSSSVASKIEPSPTSGMGAARWRAYALCLLCFVAAVLSKTVTCTFPAALVLILWWKRGRLSRRDGLMLLPLVAIALAVAKLTSGMEQWNVGAVGPDFTFSWADRVLIAGRAVWFYVAKLLWPHPLIFIYPRWQIDPRTAWQWIFPVAAVMVIVALWLLRKRIGRGPLVAVLLFVGTLFPALGFINVYPMRFSFVADHFQYLASAGLIAMAVHGVWKIRMPEHVRNIAIAVVLLVFASLTFRQALAYRDEPTLWLDTLAKNPGCWLAMDDLAEDVARETPEHKSDIPAALQWFDRSLAVHPNQPEAHMGRGRLLIRLNPPQWNAALAEFEAALKLRPDVVKPIHAKAQLLVARADWHAAHRAEAEKRENESMAVVGRVAEVADLHDAATAYEIVLARDPRLESARLEYARLLLRLQRPDAAAAQYAEALKINPDSPAAMAALAALLYRTGHPLEAAQMIDEAIKIDPSNANSYNTSGFFRLQAGHPAEAAEQFRRALELKPDFAEARVNLESAERAGTNNTK